MERETSESPYFNTITRGKSCAHLFKDRFDAKFDIQMGQVPLQFSQSINQFRFSHQKLAISLQVIVNLIIL